MLKLLLILMWTLSWAQTPHPEDCDDPAHEHTRLAAVVAQIAMKPIDALYEEMKGEFLRSPMCDPLKVINNPKTKLPAPVISKLLKDLKQIDYLGNEPGPKDTFLEGLAQKWQLTPELSQEILPLLNSLKPFGADEENRKVTVNKIKGLIIQSVLKNFVPDGNIIQEVSEELAQNKVFTRTPEGQIECPFISKDAFMKALSGHERVLKDHKNIKKKGQITIVDYSRPSNERRMFVLDLDKKIVLHNTWVAHGSGGGSETAGKDGFGSSPEMSNLSGSNKSSDGFIIAANASEGAKYGKNVILKGVDTNNTNMQARAVVLHGWDSPMSSYSDGLSMYNMKTKKYDPPVDVTARVMKTNFRSANTEEIEIAIRDLGVASSTNAYMNSTEGCLGVPKTNAKHLDRKGRDKSQLELLREDLPGSVIFNYSGPTMKSKYLP